MLNQNLKEIKVEVDIPECFDYLWEPARYKVAWGGRGGAKSWNYARVLLIRAMEEPLLVLCTREYQNSIQDSVHRLLSNQIEVMGIGDYYQIQQQTITSHCGAQFIFAGIKNNPLKIKSTEGVDIAWVEEAEKLSDRSWEILIPTIRKDNSEIWVIFNPDESSDPTYRRFVTNPPPDAVVREVNFRDNPWFPEALRKEKDYLLSVDPDAYAHVWEGKCRQRSQAQILRGKYTVQSFEPNLDWDGPYQGADWGFSVDPATLVRCWVYGNKLWIEHEFWGLGVEIDVLPTEFDVVPNARDYVIRADSARPETISYLKRNGFPRIIGVNKWKGSVEDGIAFLRAFEQIVIHPRCTHTIEEARLWSYKTDRLTGDILPEVVDAHNHCWDGIRYALEPIIRAGQNVSYYDGCDLS